MITLLDGLPHSFYMNNHGGSNIANEASSYSGGMIYSRLGLVNHIGHYQFSGFGLYTRISGSFIDWGARASQEAPV